MTQMPGEDRPAKVAKLQRRLIRDCVGDEVLAWATTWREKAAVTGHRSPRSVSDLSAISPTRFSELGSPEGLLVRPTLIGLRRHGPKPVKRKLRWLSLTLRGSIVGPKIIDPLYKPIHWVIDDGVPIGSTEADLGRLADLGRRWLTMAGVKPSDAIVSVVEPGPRTDLWHLMLGARASRVPLASLPSGSPPAEVARLGPTVLAGRPEELVRIGRELGETPRSAIHTALVMGGRCSEAARLAVSRALPQAMVLEAWAPPGVRALWVQCRGGDGLHTWPDAELIEIVNGRVVWTGLGWRGSALVRLDTGVTGQLDVGRCGACGSQTPRLHLDPAIEEDRPAAAAASAPVPAARPTDEPGDGSWPEPVLDAIEGIAAWQAVVRRRAGEDELIVYLAVDGDLGEVLTKLEEGLGADQYVVLEVDDVLRRIAENGNRVVDERLPVSA
jgi:hypothetical protein